MYKSNDGWDWKTAEIFLNSILSTKGNKKKIQTGYMDYSAIIKIPSIRIIVIIITSQLLVLVTIMIVKIYSNL